MDVRVWGVAEDRLIEACVNAIRPGEGIRIEGLPSDRSKSTGDRVRAALMNSGLLTFVGPASVAVRPAVAVGCADLDLMVAVALLAAAGRIRPGLRWIMAVGRLGLDGSVRDPETRRWIPLTDALEGIVVPAS